MRGSKGTDPSLPASCFPPDWCNVQFMQQDLMKPKLTFQEPQSHCLTLLALASKNSESLSGLRKGKSEERCFQDCLHNWFPLSTVFLKSSPGFIFLSKEKVEIGGDVKHPLHSYTINSYTPNLTMKTLRDSLVKNGYGQYIFSQRSHDFYIYWIIFSIYWALFRSKITCCVL